MFKLFRKAGKFLVEALIAYAASDQGKGELQEILDGVEALGFDVPFYEPSEGEVGEVGVQGYYAEESADPNVSHSPARRIPRSEG